MGFKFLKFLKGDGRLDDVMKMPCTALGTHKDFLKLVLRYFYLVNWEDILDEISSSNIVQRYNVAFAKKLNKDIAKIAKEKDSEVDI